VIEGLLVKDPGRRMDVHEAERRLSDVTDTPTTHVDPPTLPTPAGDLAPPPRHEVGHSGNRRRTVVRSLLALALAACLAGGGLWWLKGGSDGQPARASGANASTPSPSTDPTVPPLPAGYHLAKPNSGLALPIRNGWTRKTLPGGELAYIDPSGLVGLRVNVVEFAGTDPLQHWRETEEAQTARDNPGYERVRMAETTFRERPAGYWEFTFDGRARKYRAAELAFASADGTQYVIYISAPDAQWATYRPAFDTAVKGVRLNDGA
jgi:eukaryotic-like serine/threonine-protein kinase